MSILLLSFFFFNDTATTEIYTLSLHDALPISARVASIMENTNLSKQQQVSEIMRQMLTQAQTAGQYLSLSKQDRKSGSAGMPRPISYAVFCLKKKKEVESHVGQNFTYHHLIYF